ncbi:MAG: hypothetical protein LBJ92_02045 [Holosporales bacterium]|jgi:hypothetical protein|nr:hypothetical protein [Holosporales bacterium]
MMPMEISQERSASLLKSIGVIVALAVYGVGSVVNAAQISVDIMVGRKIGKRYQIPNIGESGTYLVEWVDAEFPIEYVWKSTGRITASYSFVMDSDFVTYWELEKLVCDGEYRWSADKNLCSLFVNGRTQMPIEMTAKGTIGVSSALFVHISKAGDAQKRLTIELSRIAITRPVPVAIPRPMLNPRFPVSFDTSQIDVKVPARYTIQEILS